MLTVAEVAKPDGDMHDLGIGRERRWSTSPMVPRHIRGLPTVTAAQLLAKKKTPISEALDRHRERPPSARGQQLVQLRFDLTHPERFENQLAKLLSLSRARVIGGHKQDLEIGLIP